MATSYANSGGTGNREGLIMVTTTATRGGSSGPWQRLVNGTAAANGTHGCWFSNGQSSKTMTFDFRPTGSKQVIDEVKWYQDVTSNHGTWKWRGSNDGSSWTDLSSTFTLVGGSSGSVIGDLSANVTAYWFYQLFQTAGTTSDGPWIEEVEFKLEASTPSAGSCSYANAGGTGNRTATITATTTASTAAAGGTIDNLIDGGTGANSTDSWAIAAAQSGKVITFDFSGFANKQVINQVKMKSDVVSDYTTNASTWKWQRSDDGSSYTDIGNGGAFFFVANSTGSILGDLSANTTGYKYYRLTEVTAAGTDTTPWNEEIEFRLVDETTEADLTAANTLGVTQATTLTREVDKSAANSLGVTMAASLSNTASLSAAPSLGVTETVTLTRQKNLTAAPSLGLSMAAAFSNTHTRQPVIVILT